MRILHVNNVRRGKLQSVVKVVRTVMDVERENGCDVRLLALDSRDLPDNLLGRLRAFKDGIWAPRAVRLLEREIRDFEPDIVHVHEFLPLFSGWIFARCQKLGVPVVTTPCAYRITCPIQTHFHDGAICTKCLGGREYWCVLKNCRGNLAESLAVATHNVVVRKFRLMHDHVDRHLAVSDFMARWLVEQAGIPAERVATIRPPLDIPIPDEPADPGRGRYVAFAGRFVPEKGIPVLVEATRRAGLPLHMSGDSLDPIPGADHVTMVPAENHEELARFYRGARIVAMPSIWHEVFGLVAAEAMSHGIPVVASRAGGLQEFVRHGETGFLCEPGDVDELAERLRQLWDDPELCRRMGARGREEILGICGVQAYYERLRRVYDEVLAERALGDRAEPVTDHAAGGVTEHG